MGSEVRGVEPRRHVAARNGARDWRRRRRPWGRGGMGRRCGRIVTCSKARAIRAAHLRLRPACTPRSWHRLRANEALVCWSLREHLLRMPSSSPLFHLSLGLSDVLDLPSVYLSLAAGPLRHSARRSSTEFQLPPAVHPSLQGTDPRTREPPQQPPAGIQCCCCCCSPGRSQSFQSARPWHGLALPKTTGSDPPSVGEHLLLRLGIADRKRRASARRHGCSIQQIDNCRRPLRRTQYCHSNPSAGPPSGRILCTTPRDTADGLRAASWINEQTLRCGGRTPGPAMT